MSQGRTDGGFALTEAMVALAIAALALGAVSRTIAGTVAAQTRIEMQRKAIGAAQSHINALEAEDMLTFGVSAGRYANGINWRLTATPLLPGKVDEDTAQPAWLRLETFDAVGRPIIDFETAKIGMPRK